ncbi:helix-turn-helix domain-containing protein [Variovorax saccharolyticus]|uniref:helix-turn-helix domain-containing protein n=1 Tax=Variovorax saccharolyticus TaxID=3053516 RepID=UPI0025789661|nr:helix-turn-helix domain-containing protein [Variovorax sp. J22R187]MDM0021883.1 helix-turn-helix domain-containing protein [Variovorax sp. J22R187]
MAEVAKLVNASSDLGTMLDRIVLAICRYTQWDMSSIMSIDERTGRTVLMARYDPLFMDVPTAPRTWDLATSPALQVMRTGKPVILLDAQNDTNYPFYQEDARARNYSTVVIAPLPARDAYERQMVIAVQSKAAIDVDDEALEFLLTVSHLAAIAVEKAHKLAEERALSDHMRRTVETAGVLMKLVLSDSSASHVLEVVEQLLGRKVCVTDHSAVAVLTSEATGRDPAVLELLPPVRQRLDSALRAPTHGSRSAGALPPFLQGREQQLDVDGAIVGSLYILGEASEVDALDELLVQQVQFSVSVLLMRSVVRFNSLAESQSTLLEELALGGWRKEEDVRLRAAAVGVHIGAPAYLAVVSLPMQDHQRAEWLEQHHRAVSFLVSQAFDKSAVVMIRPSELLVWFSPSESGPDAFRSDGPLLKVLCTELGRLLGESTFLCISDRCVGIADYAAAWSACQRMSELSLRFGRRGVVHETDFGPDALILAALPHDGVRKFQSKVLDRIAAFDERNGSELLPTVESFMICNCKLQRCADAMSIHVTTLRYRLERVRELFGIDFESADQRFSLQLALRIRALEAPARHTP